MGSTTKAFKIPPGKNNNNLIKKWANKLNRHFPKKTYRWLIGTWKDAYHYLLLWKYHSKLLWEPKVLDLLSSRREWVRRVGVDPWVGMCADILESCRSSFTHQAGDYKLETANYLNGHLFKGNTKKEAQRSTYTSLVTVNLFTSASIRQWPKGISIMKGERRHRKFIHDGISLLNIS